jgi:hypothetical protein
VVLSWREARYRVIPDELAQSMVASMSWRSGLGEIFSAMILHDGLSYVFD